MKLIDLASAILIRSGQFSSIQSSKEAILQTFKNDFPYWSYSDWNIDIPFSASKAIVRIFEDSYPTSNQLIVDLPVLITSFSKVHSEK